LYSKYEKRYGEKRSERPTIPSAAHAGKRKQAWGRLFGGPGASPACSSSSAPSGLNELTTYMDSDPITDYVEDFDILLWWRNHRLTYPVLSILARDVLSNPRTCLCSIYLLAVLHLIYLVAGGS
jgi:hypothetical protein